MQHFDVIIVGGGPTGAALGLELGLHGIKTLILEKHDQPLLSPRAQSINARSMEFFMRWQLADQLKDNILYPKDYPIRGVWCSKLNGKTYSTSSSNELLTDELSPQRGIRIPLWITENVLREKLVRSPSVTFLKNHHVTQIQLHPAHIEVSCMAKKHHTYSCSFVIACDGANSTVRNQIGIPFKTLAKAQRIMNLMFKSPDLMDKITVEKGFLYYLLAGQYPGAIGPVDPKNGVWYAQIRAYSEIEDIQTLPLETILEEFTGIHFSKKILQAHFWNMHIHIAENFSYDNRVFLVGDSAHGFVPTGGFGLNTGFGDVTNLAWKLAHVIQHKMSHQILASYQQERYGICLNNLHLAQKNADDMMNIRHQYDPTIYPEQFAKANAELGEQHTHSLGATMGYAYFDSPFTLLNEKQSCEPMSTMHYQPVLAPGYFLPHVWLEPGISIYQKLSPIHWTLISSDHSSEELKNWQDKFSKRYGTLDLVILKKPCYSKRYILIRPDWHIAYTADKLDDVYFEYINAQLND